MNLFDNNLCLKQVYRGYVDDPRNTDNSWMETVAVNFHDETGELVGKLQLQAGKLVMRDVVLCYFYTE